jgi:zinc transport system substrate-binding protein
MRKLWLAALLCLLLAACRPGRVATSEKPVVAALYPLAFVAERVGGEEIDVDNLTKPGAEPHDLELAPSQVRLIRDAALVVYLRGGFQPAVDSAVDRIPKDRALDVLSVPELKAKLRPGSAEEHAEEEEGHEEEQLAYDPHVWLDPVLMQEVTNAVGEAMARIDQANASKHEDRTQTLVADLEALDEEFKNGLSQCARRDFVTSHSAFGYLADRYGLNQVGITGLSPEAEPSPQRLAEVTRFVKKRGVTTIFFETLVSPKIAESLAKEVGVATDVLDPIEGRPEGGDYIEGMKSNLQKLRTALDCK